MSVETDNETHSLRARLGVRGSLLLAFFGIAAFAVLAAGFAMHGFVVVGTSLEQITQYRVPSTIASQKLSRQAERIAATAPAMLTVKTEGEREQLSAYLAAEFDKVEALLADLENRELDSASLVSIKVLVGRLDETAFFVTSASLRTRSRHTSGQTASVHSM